ncbi:MAG: hypothetical protein ACRYG2_27850 [Janthinobacterium lividum]
MLRSALSALAVTALATAALLVPTTASADITGDVSVVGDRVVFTPDGKSGTAEITYTCDDPAAVTGQEELQTALFQPAFRQGDEPGPDSAYPDKDLYVTCDGASHSLTVTYTTKYAGDDAEPVENGKADLGFYFGAGGPGDFGPVYREVRVSGVDARAEVALTTNAHPEHVKKGKKITVDGTIRRNGKAYAKKIDLEFKPDGGTYAKITSVTSSSKGKLSTRIRASSSGSFRYTFKGTSLTQPGTSGGDHIIVES